MNRGVDEFSSFSCRSLGPPLQAGRNQRHIRRNFPNQSLCARCSPSIEKTSKESRCLYAHSGRLTSVYKHRTSSKSMTTVVDLCTTTCTSLQAKTFHGRRLYTHRHTKDYRGSLITQALLFFQEMTSLERFLWCTYRSGILLV